MAKCRICYQEIDGYSEEQGLEAHLECVAEIASQDRGGNDSYSLHSKGNFSEESSSNKGKEKSEIGEEKKSDFYYLEVFKSELTTNLESFLVNQNQQTLFKLEDLETSQNSQKLELEKIKTETGEIKDLVEKNKTKITDLIQSLTENQRGEKSENLKNTIANELKNTNEEIKKLINEKHLEIEKKLATIITKISNVDSQIHNIDSKLNEQKTQIEKSLRTNKKLVVCVVIFSLLLVIGNLLFPRKKENKNSLTS